MSTVIDWFVKPWAQEPTSFAEWAHLVAIGMIGMFVLVAVGCGS